MTIEIQKKKCKICNELKSRIAYGKFGTSNNKRWIDEDGKQWNGLVCPSCQRKRALVNMHKLRGKSE